MPKVLSLKNSGIKSLRDIKADSFDYEKIDVSHNEITSLDGIIEIRTLFPKVKEINLSHNKIEVLKEQVSNFISELNLSYNSIHTIEPSFFFGGSELLNLSHNNIKQLNGRINPIALINLSFNPLEKHYINPNQRFIATNTPISDSYHITKTLPSSIIKQYGDDFYTITLPKGMALFRWVKNIEDIAESYVGYPSEFITDREDVTYLHPQHRVWFYPSPIINEKPFFSKRDVYRAIFVLTDDVECILGMYPGPYNLGRANLDHIPEGMNPTLFRDRFMTECQVTNILYRYPCIKKEILDEHPNIQGICGVVNDTVKAGTTINMLPYTSYNTLFKTKNGYAVPEISIFPMKKEFRLKSQDKDMEFEEGIFSADWLIENSYKYNFIPLDAALQKNERPLEYDNLPYNRYNYPNEEYRKLIDELLYRDENGFWMVKS